MTTLNRRHFLTLAGLSAIGLTATACAGTGGNTASSSSGSASNDTVTELTWWSNHPGKSKDVETELIKRFEAKNPGISIKLVDAGKNYEEVAQKFNAALTGSDLPDIVVLADAWWFNFAINGQIAEVNELAAKASVKTDTYVPSLYKDYELNGAHYAFPFARSTPLFYYNKQVWSDAGLPDRGPETWQEMDEWGRIIQAKLDGRSKAHGWANAKDYISWTFEGPMWTFGGAYSNGWDLALTQPDSLRAVEWLKDTVRGESPYAVVSQQLSQDFSSGLVASAIMSTGSLNGISKEAKFDFGTAPLPNPTGNGGCPTGGAGLAIPSGIPENRQIAAAKFIDFITNDANTSYWSREVGYMPVRTTAQENPEQKRFMDEHPNYATAVNQLPHTRVQDNAQVFIPGGASKISGAFETILNGNGEVQPVMEQLEKDLKQIFDSQVKPKLK